MREFLNPALVDQKLFASLVARYARRQTDGELANLQDFTPGMNPSSDMPIDEFEKSCIRSAEDIRDIFVDRFYFGCEGDDPLTAMAFNPRGIPFDAKLKPLYGSDIGHWDVSDMSKIGEETYELVEHGVIDEGSLRSFLFDNAVTFWTANNRDFFKGTAVEDEVAGSRAGIVEPK